MAMYIWSAKQTSPSLCCSKHSVSLVFHKEVKQMQKKKKSTNLSNIKKYFI